MNGHIESIAALEGVIGKTPPQMHLKVIDHLDVGAQRWLADSPLMFAGFGGDGGIDITLGGGACGFAQGDASTLTIPVAQLDNPALAKPGAAFGSLFLIPGIRETLRINGKVISVDAEQVRIAVDDCYGHCAKALIRSELWSAPPQDAPPGEPADFVAASRFMALATIGAENRADMSPKGDPSGSLARLDGDALWFADRPGNRRVDSFRNIIDRPAIAVALLIPGSAQVAILKGDAQLTVDDAARERFTVREKMPLLAIRVSTCAIELHESAALTRANLWPVRAESAIDAGKLFVEHIKLNRSGGVVGTLARAGLAVPGAVELLRKGLEKDYKENLY